MSRPAEVARATGETDVELASTSTAGAGTRGTGVGFLDHMLDLLARHGRLDLEVQAAATSRPARTTPSRTSGIVLGQALDEALGDRAGHHAATATAWCRWTRRCAACAIDLSGRPLCVFDGRPAAGSDRRLRHASWPRSSSARSPTAPRLTLHVEPLGGHERPPRDRGQLQGLRPRAARRRGDRPEETEVPVHQGHAER